MRLKIFFLIFIVFLSSCSSSNYDGNYYEGAFSAEIGNQVIFTNGPDILEVNVHESQGVIEDLCLYDDVFKEYTCPYSLTIMVSEKAAKREQRALERLTIINNSGIEMFDEKLTLYLRNDLLGTIQISPSLIDNPITEITIFGYGVGITKKQALDNAQASFFDLYKILKDEA